MSAGERAEVGLSAGERAEVGLSAGERAEVRVCADERVDLRAAADQQALRPAAPGTEVAPGERWVALIRGEDRPGTLTALTSVFSTRGVSFESLATGAVDGDAGTIAVTFVATARRKHLLARTVARLSVVRSIDVRSGEDPLVRAAGVVRMPAGVAFTPSDAGQVRWSGDAAAGQPVLVEGALADVTAVMAQARERGAAMTAVVILGF